MTIILLITLVALLLFAFGVLTGSGMTTHAQDVRDRRQATVQRHINDKWRVLRDQQEDQ